MSNKLFDDEDIEDLIPEHMKAFIKKTDKILILNALMLKGLGDSSKDILKENPNNEPVKTIMVFCEILNNIYSLKNNNPKSLKETLTDSKDYMATFKSTMLKFAEIVNFEISDNLKEKD